VFDEVRVRPVGDVLGEGQILCHCHPIVTVKALCFQAVSPFVRPSGQIMLPRYLMNSLSVLHETNREYSLSPTDDLILEVKNQGHTRPSQSNVVNAIFHELLEQLQ